MDCKLIKPLFFTSLMGLCSALPAQASIERANEIARSVEASDRGYQDETVTGELNIRSADGTEVNRTFTMTTLEVAPGGDKRVVVFEKPRDLAGFVSLNHSEILEPDKQWIYLPALKRSRRLSARDKTGAFAGSEFSYEDIVRWELEKYEYRYVGQENCAQTRCEVIEDIPLYPYSGYSKLVESIDMDILQPRKIVYYDLQGRAFKELELFEYKKIGKYWRPMRSRMTNLITQAVSEIQWQNYEFQQGLNDRDFRAERIAKWSR